jgi:hypothetical protein
LNPYKPENDANSTTHSFTDFNKALLIVIGMEIENTFMWWLITGGKYHESIFNFHTNNNQ